MARRKAAAPAQPKPKDEWAVKYTDTREVTVQRGKKTVGIERGRGDGEVRLRVSDFTHVTGFYDSCTLTVPLALLREAVDKAAGWEE